MTRFTLFSEFCDWLEELGLFHMELSLGRMEAFIARAGLAPMVSAQVLGTNGKGSTAAYLEALARGRGIRTGLYASPHFVSVRERILVDGGRLSEERWVELANKALEIGGDLSLTYFEVLTCICLLAFSEAGVGLAVMETGLGGSYDAVTAYPHDAALYAPIGMDHMAVLGKTLSAIATDKAGAIKSGQDIFSAPQKPEALAILQRTADERGARLLLPEDLPPLPEGTRLAMAGPHQVVNARLALAAWRSLAARFGVAPDPALEADALGRARLPGRFERIPGNPEIILDGAHNEPALHALAAALKELGVTPAALVFACFADKDLDALAPLAVSLTPGPIFTPPIPEAGRRSDPEATVSALGPRARLCASLEEALDLAKRAATAAGGPVLVCGSLYLLAEFYRNCLTADALGPT